MSASDSELRDLIRTLVISALQRLGTESSSPAPEKPSPRTAPGKRILLLFTSRDSVPEEFYQLLGTLTAQEFSFAAAFSATFHQAHPVEAVMARLPKQTIRISGNADEESLLSSLTESAAVLSPGISANTAAKVVQGIEDSLPSVLLRNALLDGKPVFVARDLPQIERELADRHSAASPALLRSLVDMWHRLQNYGVRFIPLSRIGQEIAGLFQPVVNETPARLARTKPAARRVFVTAEDIWNAFSSGQKELLHPADAIVTDAARDEAAARNITLRPQ